VASRPLPERYLLLGLRLDRHVDGLVDGYYGPPELKTRVEGEEPVAADVLVDEANALLVDAEEADLEPQRRRWLSAQLRGLACVAEMVSGAEIAWTDAVRRCYGVEVSPAAEDDFARVHEQLDAALPGSGELAERLERWKQSQELAPETVLPAFQALIDELRKRASGLTDLPDGEWIDVELVTGEPWAAYNWYLGELKSRIEINTDLPLRSYFLAVLAAHEAYPGHHTEAVCKEARLVRERGHVETSILLIHTPECLVSEGIAQIAIEQAFGDEWVAKASEILRPLDVPFDVEVAQVVADAQDALEDVDVNIAYHSSESGWSVDDSVAYHRRWALSPEDRARKSVGFDTHPMWSVYVPTYSRGRRLAREFASSTPDGFRRLLNEQLTTADLDRSAASAP
jgi:hypothetical protein